METLLNEDIKRRVGRVPLYEGEPRTLAELFLLAAARHARADALNYRSGGEWRPISSERMLSRITNIALGLIGLGLKKGERAAILAPNSPEWTLADAGCQFAGIIDVPIYTTLSPGSVAYILNDSGSKVFFLADAAEYERLSGVLEDCRGIDRIVFLDSDSSGPEGSISLAELEEIGAGLKTDSPDLVEGLPGSLDKDDVATLIYTSGTTGEPKGVMLTHENLISNVIDAGEKFSFSADDVPLSVLPLSHVFERTGMYLYIFNGMAVHYAESIEKVPDNLKEVRPTMFVGVPRIFEKVYAKAKLAAARHSVIREKIFDWAIDVGKRYALKNEMGVQIPRTLSTEHGIADRLVYSKLRDFFGGRLRFCITGGAALSDEIFLIFTGAGISIMQGYGLTETSPVISSNNPVESRLGSVGKPIRNVEVRIADDGEIEICGPNVMTGYHNKPEATRDTFTADGWFRTGDIGELDEEGFLRITDRKKELFKTSGGKYIAPSPIEQMLKGSRFVNQAVLVGDGRKFAAALIVPEFEQLKSYAVRQGWDFADTKELCSMREVKALFDQEVLEQCRGLARFERVKRIALLEHELTVEGGEMTPTLKIKRRVVNEKYAPVIDGIYLQAEKEKPAK